jgi:hypothetical protein
MNKCNIQRIRNNILKSGKDCKRQLTYQKPILLEHWINAFKWDRDTYTFPIYHKLSNEHLFFTQESKMRNKLAISRRCFRQRNVKFNDVFSKIP